MPESTRLVYLDVCALCRPFDDPTQIRVRVEAEAVQLILSHVRAGDLTLVVSPAHQVEIGAIADVTERVHLLTLLQQSGVKPAFDLPRVRQRAEALTAQGCGLADAAHLAFAEAAGADFVTCDDRLLRQCRRVGSSAWCGTPLAFCDKEELV
jgi:predicted nucleic acid-binding protein